MLLLPLIIIFDGYIFLNSGWGKISGGIFAGGLGKTLTTFASKNPYPWFKDFLVGVAIPNSQILGNLIPLGELFIGLTLIFGAIYVLLIPKISLAFKFWLMLGAASGASLNLLFYLASGWTSSSTASLNLLMLVIELVAIMFIWQLPTQKKTLFS